MEAKAGDSDLLASAGQDRRIDLADLGGFTSRPRAPTEDKGRVSPLSAVYACHYVLSSNVAQLPAAVLRKQGENISLATDHPAFDLIHAKPNDFQTSYKWRETKQHHVLGWGNGYSPTTDYTVGQRVVYESKVYECVQTPNKGNTPGAAPLYWALAGPTNRWAMFDSEVSTQTIGDSPLRVVVRPGLINSLALLEPA